MSGYVYEDLMLPFTEIIRNILQPQKLIISWINNRIPNIFRPFFNFLLDPSQEVSVNHHRITQPIAELLVYLEDSHGQSL
ncbi:MAG: hypothetical protein OEL83_07085 [Desulforhopalus sp.]|nr:hypothetical protein [Desulforhopalus sp.]